MLATGKRGVIAFAGAYHGLGYGALNATHRDFFRSPFHSQLREFGHFVPFPEKSADLAAVEWSIRQLFRREWIGAILVEPVQGARRHPCSADGISAAAAKTLRRTRRAADSR